MKKVFYCILAIFLVFISIGAHAQVITFDDLPATSFSKIPEGYGGLDYSSNFWYLTASTTPFSGYRNGAFGSNVAFNALGASVSFSDTLFTLNSFYATAAWREDLDFTVRGTFAGGDTITKSFVLSSLQPSYIQLDWDNLASVYFNAEGGVQNSQMLGDGTHFVLDNITINERHSPVPEPGTLVLLGLGLSGSALIIRKCKK